MSNQSMGLIATSVLLTGFTLLTGCGGAENGSPTVSSSAGQSGAMATLAWNPVQDPSISGYYVHYGKVSPNQPGACSYDEQQFVSSPTATITSLDHSTRYYFAVSAYNGLESLCSNEVFTNTPASPA